MLVRMSRHPSPVRRQARSRSLGCVFLAMLVIALSAPTLATAAPKASAGVRNCTHFSRVRMAELLQTTFLEFEGRNPVANICTYKTPHESGHYASLFTVSVRATSQAVFQVAEHAAGQQARANPHQVFGFSVRSDSFWVRGTYLSAALEECPREHSIPEFSIPEFGPPTCKGEPDWATYSFYTYAALRPRGPKVFVSVGIAGQEENVSATSVNSVAREILSGRIR